MEDKSWWTEEGREEEAEVEAEEETAEDVAVVALVEKEAIEEAAWEDVVARGQEAREEIGVVAREDG
jgi:hypothetical protein